MTEAALVVVGSARGHRRSMLDMLLIARGFAVAHCASGSALLELLKRETPNAAVIDLDLPGVDVRDLCNRMRRSRRLSRTALVLVTPGLDDDAARERFRAIATSEAADLVIPEPLGDKDLGGRLERLLAERTGEAPARTAQGSEAASHRRNRLAELESEAKVLRAQLKAYLRDDGPPARLRSCQEELAERDRVIGELRTELARAVQSRAVKSEAGPASADEAPVTADEVPAAADESSAVADEAPDATGETLAAADGVPAAGGESPTATDGVSAAADEVQDATVHASVEAKETSAPADAPSAAAREGSGSGLLEREQERRRSDQDRIRSSLQRLGRLDPPG